MKKFFINGQWTESEIRETVFDPWTGAQIGEFCLATPVQIGQAVETAHNAFQQHRLQPAWERAKTLQRAAELIRQRREEFAGTIVAEAGKPVALAEAEVDRAAMTFDFAASLAIMDEGHCVRMDGSPQGAGHFGMVRRFPIGVILGITPFNFPLNLVAHKMAPCLAAGNAMVLKPSPRTPLSALLLAEVLQEAGVPDGLIHVVPFGHEHIPGLLTDSRLKMLSFTGSAAVGWQLKASSAKLRVALELGGNASVIIEPDSDWHHAIPVIASAAYGYAGQSCISVQRIFVQREIYPAFRDAFVAHVQEHIKAGDPRDRATVCGPMINEAARNKVLGWITEAKAAGAGLPVPPRIEGKTLLHPVVLENVPHDCKIVREEAFAPVAVLEAYDALEDAIRLVNDGAYGLQAGIYTRDLTKALHAWESLDAGGVMINQVPTFRVENMPYGGVKDSGFGREGLRYAMDEMTEPRLLVINRQ